MKQLFLILLLSFVSSCSIDSDPPYKCTEEIFNNTGHTIELTFLDSNESHDPSMSTYHTKVKIKPYSTYSKKKEHRANHTSHTFVDGRGLYSIIIEGFKKIDLSDPKNESIKEINDLFSTKSRWICSEDMDHWGFKFIFTDEDFANAIPIPR